MLMAACILKVGLEKLTEINLPTEDWLVRFDHELFRAQKAQNLIKANLLQYLQHLEHVA